MRYQVAALVGLLSATGCIASYSAAGTVYRRPDTVARGLVVPTVSETRSDSVDPLGGVTVTCDRCEPTSMVTDVDGAFRLTIPEGSVPVMLTFAVSGYDPVEVELQVDDPWGQVAVEPITVFLSASQHGP